jgi:DICT domain-containing protein
MLEQREQNEQLDFDRYFFSLCRDKFGSYREVLDTLARKFTIHSVTFEPAALGKEAETLLNRRTSFQPLFVISIDSTRNNRDRAFIISKFLLELASVDYRVTNGICPYNIDECEVEIRSVTPLHSR